MIDAIDLLNIPFYLESVARGETIRQRDHRVLLDYLEEFPLGKHAQDIKQALKVVKIAEPEPMPTAEELEAILEDVSEQEKKQKADKRKRKK